MGARSYIKRKASEIKTAAVAMKDAVVAVVRVPGDKLGEYIVDNSQLQNTTNSYRESNLTSAIRATVGQNTSITTQSVDESANLDRLVYKEGGLETEMKTMEKRMSINSNITPIMGPDGKTKIGFTAVDNDGNKTTVTAQKNDKGQVESLTTDRGNDRVEKMSAVYSQDGKLMDALVVDKGNGSFEVAIRGSKTSADWDKNRRFGMTTPEKQDGAQHHSGFESRASELAPAIEKLMPQEVQTVKFSGHSLGGAVAQILAVKTKEKHPEYKIETITFGAPPVGNKAYAERIQRATDGNNIRVVTANDPVPSSLAGDYVHAAKPVIMTGEHIFVGANPDSDGKGLHFKTSAFDTLVNGTQTSHNMGYYRTHILSAAFVEKVAMESAKNKALEAPLSTGVSLATDGIGSAVAVGVSVAGQKAQRSF